MKAILLDAFGDPSALRLAEIETPEPGPGAILVRVRACGVNRLDLDVRSGRSRYALRFPHILGREAVGEVAVLGPGCERFRIGDRVLVRAHYSCWRCEHCMAGEEHHCARALLPGIDVPGGYAEYMTAPERALLPIPEEMPFTIAAAVQIAFGTAWHALVGVTRVRPGERVLVTGAGGAVGTAMVQLARHCGAEVIAAAGSAEKLEVASQLGASATVNYEQEELDVAIERITAGRGVDVVIETLGGEIFRRAVAALATNGRLLVVGAHAGEVVPLDLVPLFRKQVALLGSRRVTTLEVERVLALVARGVLRPVIHAVRPLAEAGLVHEAMARRVGIGKWVLAP